MVVRWAGGPVTWVQFPAPRQKRKNNKLTYEINKNNMKNNKKIIIISLIASLLIIIGLFFIKLYIGRNAIEWLKSDITLNSFQGFLLTITFYFVDYWYFIIPAILFICLTFPFIILEIIKERKNLLLGNIGRLKYFFFVLTSLVLDYFFYYLRENNFAISPIFMDTIISVFIILVVLFTIWRLRNAGRSIFFALLLLVPFALLLLVPSVLMVFYEFFLLLNVLMVVYLFFLPGKKAELQT